MLTAYISPSPSRDTASSRELKAKLEDAIRRVERALSPWELSQKSSSSRRKSLQSILGTNLDSQRKVPTDIETEEARRAGMMLFSQRSVYVFDWSKPQSKGGKRPTVTPTLLKEMDEYGQALSPPETIVAGQ